MDWILTGFKREMVITQLKENLFNLPLNENKSGLLLTGIPLDGSCARGAELLTVSVGIRFFSFKGYMDGFSLSCVISRLSSVLHFGEFWLVNSES